MLFQDKCPGVGDPRGNHPPPAWRGGKSTRPRLPVNPSVDVGWAFSVDSYYVVSS